MNARIPPPNRRVLIVDDNPAIHADFRKILCPPVSAASELNDLKAALFSDAPRAPAEVAFELVSAYQGEEALDTLRRAVADDRPFALVFLDVRMPPGWDGIQTAGHLWRESPDLQVVICTAYSDYSWEDMRHEFDRPENLVILKKPFDNIEVLQLAHALTAKWNLTRQVNRQLADLESEVGSRTRELEAANAALRISEERFHKAFVQGPVPAAILSLPDLRLVELNTRMTGLVGLPREQMLGQPASALRLWPEQGGIADALNRLLAGFPVPEQQAPIRTANGRECETLVSLATVTLDERPHALLQLQDISGRIELENQLRQAQKMEAIGQLSAGIAHDFNNILTVIQGYAGLMLRQLEGADPMREMVEEISRASTRASTVVRQLLMFSRKQVMQFRDLDLSKSIASAVGMLKRLLGEQVQLEYEPVPSLPGVHADETMIEQIIINLAVNSRDAMPRGGRVRIRLSLQHVERGPLPLDPERRHGDFLCIAFSDTGCGMDPATLQHIFEPFFTTKAAGNGTGLGLATVFGIVRQHQGWIEVESAPGVGTTFRIFLPPARDSAPEVPDMPGVVVHHGDETILVTEDEDPLREMVARALRAEGYKVLTAASGREALDVWRAAGGKVDLLVTDMVMPGEMYGGDLARELGALAPGLKIIYTSGYSARVAGPELALREECNFLPKPYSLGKLSRLIRRCLDSRAGDAFEGVAADARGADGFET